MMTQDGIIFDSAQPLSQPHVGTIEVAEGQRVPLTPGQNCGRIVLIAGGDSPFPNLQRSGEVFFDIGKSPGLLKGVRGGKPEVLAASENGWKRGFSGKCIAVIKMGHLRLINRASKPNSP